MPKFKPIEDRFWGKVNKRGDDECWEWTGCKIPKGYGRIGRSRQRGSVATHRLSWQIHFGEIPDGLHVLHKCDNPACVNPSHLFLGTNADNVQDRVKKGRPTVPRGEKNPRAKLTEMQVVEIRKRLSAGETQTAIAKEYGMHQTAIGFIERRKHWKHVE